LSQTAAGQFPIFLFKDQNDNSTDEITVVWNGQSDRVPSSYTVYLQIYNRDSTTWETLDTDDFTGANTDFDLEGSITVNLDNYYDASNWVAHRVYQDAE